MNEEMERFKGNMEFTKLKPKPAEFGPDVVYSRVPYEKGFQFLWRIEPQVLVRICLFSLTPIS